MDGISKDVEEIDVPDVVLRSILELCRRRHLTQLVRPVEARGRLPYGSFLGSIAHLNTFRYLIESTFLDRAYVISSLGSGRQVGRDAWTEELVGSGGGDNSYDGIG